MRHLLAACAAAVVSFAAWAHGGEDHGPAAPALVGDSAPRAVAQSGEFELVAILTQGKLTLYLDLYTDNSPVADAEIEVESGTFKAVAKPLAPGVYEVPGAAFAQAGKIPLTLLVQTGDSADLLSATLEQPGPLAAPEPVQSRSEQPIWLAAAVAAAAAAVALAATALRLVRRRRQHRL